MIVDQEVQNRRFEGIESEWLSEKCFLADKQADNRQQSQYLNPRPFLWTPNSIADRQLLTQLNAFTVAWD